MFRVRFVYKILPVFVFSVKNLGDFAGKTLGPIVRIKKDYVDDKGLIEHEINHARQFYRTLGLHIFLYAFTKWYRYKSEIECFKIQLKYCPDFEAGVKRFGEFLATRYRLNIDPAKAEKDLRN